MRDTLSKVLKFVNFLWKVLPVLIDAFEDLKDDGLINGSSGKGSKFKKADSETK